MTLPDRWITDSTVSGRFPHYTRANADEIVPGPISPLGWTLLFQGALQQGSVNSWIEFGVFDEGEVDPNDKFACFGGYLYNALSVTWMLGVRMGASPEVVDHMFYGENPNGPRYSPHPDDTSSRHTAQLRRKRAWVFEQRGRIPSVAVCQATAERARRERPEFSLMSSQAVLWHIDQLLPLVRDAFTGHGVVTLGTSVAVGRLRDLLTEHGLGHLTVPLISGLGGVESSAPTLAMWNLAEEANRLDLVDEVEAGMASLRKVGKVAAEWVTLFDGFLKRYGSRGQCEYDLITPSWETNPDLALGAIAVMCRQGVDRSMVGDDSGWRSSRAEAEDVAERALSSQSSVYEEFRSVLAATVAFMTAREAAKFPFVKMTNEVRVAVVELGRRLVSAGAIGSAHDVAILTRRELELAIGDNLWAAGVVAERKSLFEELADLEPPYIVTVEAPPLPEWPKRQRACAEVAAPGTVLTGIAASPGLVTGRVRILTDASQADRLRSGEILVATSTDAGWTPLLMVAAATVIEVGAIGSHGAIVSRELGIPSVVNCPGAATSLVDGTLVEVDGTAGTVTVLASN
jgi:rifampicin phosphotransferase